MSRKLSKRQIALVVGGLAFFGGLGAVFLSYLFVRLSDLWLAEFLYFLPLAFLFSIGGVVFISALATPTGENPASRYSRYACYLIRGAWLWWPESDDDEFDDENDPP
ncbi:MAG: hypothetical protein ACLP74_00065, partial [Thermoplasmata archaeon]